MADRPLSPREMEAIRLRAQGFSVDETAARMGITRETARNHLTSVNRKLGATGTVHALLCLGWITIPDDAPLDRAVSGGVNGA